MRSTSAAGPTPSPPLERAGSRRSADRWAHAGRGCADGGVRFRRAPGGRDVRADLSHCRSEPVRPLCRRVSPPTPLRHILHLWLASRGVQFVHAGAVGRPSGGCLIVGKSGSGKSTSTLATLGSELLYAGDDYVGVSVTTGGAHVHSIYGCGKLET